MEKLLKLLSDTESISPNDELSKLIDTELNDEISEDILEFVSAASGCNYDKFKRYLENSDKND